MSIKGRIKNSIKALLFENQGSDRDYSGVKVAPKGLSSAEYWTVNNVTEHKKFANREESLAFMRFRFDQYPKYEELMPCSGFDNKIILDYGCGPGHDVIGFVEYSKPAKVIAMDVSSSSLQETKNRVALHNASDKVDIKLIKEGEKLPIESNSIDYIHSSGVLHHTPNMQEILDEFHRILKPDGIIRIMVYNYNSIWAQLYVPYVIQMVKKINSDLSLEEAFRRSTDGDSCPISNYYTSEQYLDICQRSKLKGKYLGASISLDEMDWVINYKNRAMRDINFPEKHRLFLKELTFDDRLRPLYRGHLAGINAVFELKK
jgi:ubiquinone/menaquinone biosynthesis C-methylase UbiE